MDHFQSSMTGVKQTHVDIKKGIQHFIFFEIHHATKKEEESKRKRTIRKMIKKKQIGVEKKENLYTYILYTYI